MNIKQQSILPCSRDEMNKLGWEQADIIIVSGDAYVDHPSFGTAVMARLGEYCGLKVAVLPQPNWRDDLRDFKKLGQPKYFFGVTAGCMDSMINHYTAQKRKRSDDAYSPGGKAGFRPDYAVSVYSKILKSIFPNTPIIIGGIEASLRRFTHYDYWSNKLMPSILIESKADLLLYGMAERSFIELINNLKAGRNFNEITKIPQTAYLADTKQITPSKDNSDVFLPSFKSCINSKVQFAKQYKIIEEQSSKMKSDRIIEPNGDVSIVVNPPYLPPTEKETDLSFNLPYTYLPHPKYLKKEAIPAFEMIKNSVTIHRGCFGACSFCAISSHQGKFISSRSEKSILDEVNSLSKRDYFKGHISDLGGPSANMYKMGGIDKKICMNCKKPSCIYPSVCKNLNFDHNPLIDLYQKTEKIIGVNKITIGSGIRYDMFVNKNPETDKKYGLSKYSNLLISRHVSGRLKVAPEHIADEVLVLMRKPSFNFFKAFYKQFRDTNLKNNSKQQLVLYLIAGHPGSTDENNLKLADRIKQMGFLAESIQEFTPTPMTLSTTMYYTGINPLTNENINSIKNITDLKKHKTQISNKKRR